MGLHKTPSLRSRILACIIESMESSSISHFTWIVSASWATDLTFDWFQNISVFTIHPSLPPIQSKLGMQQWTCCAFSCQISCWLVHWVAAAEQQIANLTKFWILGVTYPSSWAIAVKFDMWEWTYGIGVLFSTKFRLDRASCFPWWVINHKYDWIFKFNVLWWRHLVAQRQS